MGTELTTENPFILEIKTGLWLPLYALRLSFVLRTPIKGKL